MNLAGRESYARKRERERRLSEPDGREHLTNHYDTALTLCGRFTGSALASHYYDEPATTNLPTCADCIRIDEQACLEADAARRQPRGPFDPNPYRQTYLAAVRRQNQEQPT